MNKFLKICGAFAFSCSVIGVIACGSEEKEKTLPPLPEIDAPKTLSGMYSGHLPPSESEQMHQILFELDSNETAFVTERIQSDSLRIVLDTASYKDSADVLSILFSSPSRILKFRKKTDFQYLFLNGNNEVYMDIDSNTYSILRILNVPQKTEVKRDSASSIQKTSK